MRNYYYELIEGEDVTFSWCVIEAQTQQIIAEYAFEEDAIDMTNHLLDGHGFDGFTPAFFLE